MAITELQSPDLKVVRLADSIVEHYDDSERRGHMRLSADDVRWLRSARLKYGPDVHVLDISASGILVETEGQLRPDANIVFELSGPMFVYSMSESSTTTSSTPSGLARSVELLMNCWPASKSRTFEIRTRSAPDSPLS